VTEVLLFLASIAAAALAIGLVLFCLGLLRRLQATEQALIAVVRLMETQNPTQLPRELVDFISTHPGGVHRG
jgi:hypothetical protein